MSFQKAKRSLMIFYLWMIRSCIVVFKTVRVFSEVIGMEFGIEKYAMLVMEKRKIVKSVSIELPDGKLNKSLQEGESYNHLGILEEDKFLEEKMKLNVY